MANTLVTVKEAGGMHFYIFSTASASTTETCAVPAGKSIVAGFIGNIGGTATATTFKYTASNGNADFSALTSTNAYILVVMTD